MQRRRRHGLVLAAAVAVMRMDAMTMDGMWMDGKQMAASIDVSLIAAAVPT